MSDESDIRALIERWVQAIRDMDIDGVLQGHAEDIVMFDVPPPYDGLRGIDAYRDSWFPFFEWLRQGAIFEIVELDVIAGEDVAFAFGLLRCGKPEDLTANPANRLRMTIGLHNRGGRWTVVHEHHSFPAT